MGRLGGKVAIVTGAGSGIGRATAARPLAQARLTSEDVRRREREGRRPVIAATVSAERKGRSWSSPEVHVWRVVDGKAVQFHEFQGDQQTEDEFWLS